MTFVWPVLFASSVLDQEEAANDAERQQLQDQLLLEKERANRRALLCVDVLRRIRAKQKEQQQAAAVAGEEQKQPEGPIVTAGCDPMPWSEAGDVQAADDGSELESAESRKSLLERLPKDGEMARFHQMIQALKEFKPAAMTADDLITAEDPEAERQFTSWAEADKGRHGEERHIQTDNRSHDLASTRWPLSCSSVCATAVDEAAREKLFNSLQQANQLTQQIHSVRQVCQSQQQAESIAGP